MNQFFTSADDNSNIFGAFERPFEYSDRGLSTDDSSNKATECTDKRPRIEKADNRVKIQKFILKI